MKNITKGKWEVNEITPAKGVSYPCVMINPHGTIIASCSDGTREETEANAQLISTAPELLEALQALLSSYKADFKTITGGELNETEAVKQAINAINKATT